MTPIQPPTSREQMTEISKGNIRIERWMIIEANHTICNNQHTSNDVNHSITRRLTFLKALNTQNKNEWIKKEQYMALLYRERYIYSFIKLSIQIHACKLMERLCHNIVIWMLHLYTLTPISALTGTIQSTFRLNNL